MSEGKIKSIRYLVAHHECQQPMLVAGIVLHRTGKAPWTHNADPFINLDCYRTLRSKDQSI
jgi:hypothetical protein